MIISPDELDIYFYCNFTEYNGPVLKFSNWLVTLIYREENKFPDFNYLWNRHEWMLVQVGNVIKLSYITSRHYS